MCCIRINARRAKTDSAKKEKEDALKEEEKEAEDWMAEEALQKDDEATTATSMAGTMLFEHTHILTFCPTPSLHSLHFTHSSTTYSPGCCEGCRLCS